MKKKKQSDRLTLSLSRMTNSDEELNIHQRKLFDLTRDCSSWNLKKLVSLTGKKKWY